jgi:hypothetical protein
MRDKTPADTSPSERLETGSGAVGEKPERLAPRPRRRSYVQYFGCMVLPPLERCSATALHLVEKPGHGYVWGIMDICGPAAIVEVTVLLKHEELKITINVIHHQVGYPHTWATQIQTRAIEVAN